jgi:ribosomal protein S18
MFSTIRAVGPKVSPTIRNIAIASENVQILRSIKRTLSTCSVLNVRKIKISEQDPDNKTGKRNISVEGVVSDMPNQTFITPTFPTTSSCQNASEHCHPLCRFSFVQEIKHTDVLILIQFMDHEGKIISRKITGLCKRQHDRTSKLIKMAAKAGLFPENKDIFKAEKQRLPATKFNAYWDDSSIDAQYLEQQRKETTRSFKK